MRQARLRLCWNLRIHQARKSRRHVPGLSRRGAGGIGRQVAHRLIASFLQFGGDGFLSPRRRGVSRPGPASATGEPVPAAVSPWLRGGGGRVQCAWSRRCLSPVTARRLLRRVGEARADHVSLQPGKSSGRLSEPGRRPGELPDIDLESSYTGHASVPPEPSDHAPAGITLRGSNTRM